MKLEFIINLILTNLKCYYEIRSLMINRYVKVSSLFNFIKYNTMNKKKTFFF